VSLAKDLISELPGRPMPHGPETPYARAQRAWDDRLGSVAVQAKNWRLATFVAMGLSAASTAGWIMQLTRPEPAALVIQVDHTTGVANVMGRLDSIAYTPQIQEIGYFLGKFIGMVRAVPQDAVVVRRNWTDAYQFMRQAAATQLDEWARKPGSALARLGEQTVATDIIAVTPVAGSKSYQVRWHETVYSKEGALQEAYVMSGIFTVEFEAQRDEKRAMVNPIGLFIKSFQWTREVTEPRPGGSAPAAMSTAGGK
jgi:type IV secretory pathway TrbF-like protein